MEVIALSKNVRISAFKCRDIARNIQGLPAAEALEVLRFIPKKAARFISKTLKTAIANAENNNNLDSTALWIKKAIVDEGITLKRYTPRARGAADLIRRRSSHIKIVLSDEPAPQHPKQSASKKQRHKPNNKTPQTT